MRYAIPAIADDCTKRGEELLRMFDASHSIKLRGRFRIIGRRQPIVLFDIEYDVTVEKRDLSLDFIAGLFIGLPTSYRIGIDHQRSLLPLRICPSSSLASLNVIQIGAIKFCTKALAQATGLRVLKAIGDAVPVRLMKRDLLFLTERLTAMLDERRLSVLIRQHGIGKPKDDAAPAKLLAAFLPKAEESKLGRILVETAILLSMHNQTDAAKILRDAAHAYKVDVDAISATVKQEFSAKEKGNAAKKAAPKPSAKQQSKTPKKSVAA
ncbi:MAG TPA: hypothetical protein VMF66_05245 [Candidatus Acidoferrum sp.]|nr:hypothetical protein [Candidatus Acidoferrum sp.]